MPRNAPLAARVLLATLLGIAGLAWSVGPSRAAAASPSRVVLPAHLSLAEALRLLRTQGIDLLIADAAVRSAQGGLRIAATVQNPSLSASVGYALTYVADEASQADCRRNGAVCTPWVNSLGINDSAALADALVGKRRLRIQVAKSALDAALFGRRDAERNLLAQGKAAYVQVALAAQVLSTARETAASQATTLALFRVRAQHGQASDADVQRIEVQKLEADQAETNAVAALREAQAALAFLLGVRGPVPAFTVDTGVLDYAVPATLRDPDELALLRAAFEHRPDLQGQGHLLRQAEAQLRLTRRQRVPDITLGITYNFGGYGGFSTNGPVGMQVLSFGVSLPIPVFNALVGDIRQAEAQVDTSALQRDKTAAQVVSDVVQGLAAVRAARAVVERMDGPRRDGGGLLESARGAFELTKIQYERGAASLTDYLDALRSLIATRTERYTNLAAYWTAVFQLEAALATELP